MDSAPDMTRLDVFTCPLEGINLIEASAGTGKTWNICVLYLRLLLEKELQVQQLLVVTFTNAAVAELRDRIRQRLVGLLAHWQAPHMSRGDPFYPQLTAALQHTHGLNLADCLDRVEQALASFDEAAIFTIHGYCQRALADTPFSAQMPLAMELLQDDGELLQQAVNDFWRRHIAGDALDPALGAMLIARKDSPAKFVACVRRHLARPTARTIWPAAMDAAAGDTVEAGCVDMKPLSVWHAQARAIWLSERDAVLQAVLEALPGLNKTSYSPDNVRAAAQEWDTLLRDADSLDGLSFTPKRARLLTAAFILAKTNKGKKTPEHGFLDAAQNLVDAHATIHAELILVRLRLLRALIADVTTRLRASKRAKRVIAFDDMLFNLHERLMRSDGSGLAAALNERFPAALIDEFQDTDPLQFGIFSAIYQGTEKPFFMVGDPKQAIYSFRNADLYTYLHARDQALNRYTIADNQRSSPHLIAGLNALFGRNAHVFMLPGLHYPEVGVGGKPRAVMTDRVSPAQAPLQVWTLPSAADGSGPVSSGQASAGVPRACAAEISRLLRAAAAGDVLIGDRPLAAGDIAVLVRSHRQGRMIRKALAALNVGCVELSQASVFKGVEAEELERVLAAINEPSREPLLKAALATELMGMEAPAIVALAADEQALMRVMERFAQYRHSWQRHGVGRMLREWLAVAQVTPRLLVRLDGERRLTNLLHLIEALHQAAIGHPSPDALLAWLQARRRDDQREDSSQLRLESDRNLVQIVTIHKSKGLEYPVVFCPFFWDGRPPKGEPGFGGVSYHDASGAPVIDYRGEVVGEAEFDAEAIKAQTGLERNAEMLRLIYVALTRAEHRCVVIAGTCSNSGSANGVLPSSRSLMNWLVAGNGYSPAQWSRAKLDAQTIASAWQALADDQPECIDVRPMPMEAGVPLAFAKDDADTLEALIPGVLPPLDWRIGSYSALAHGATHERAAVDHDARAAVDHDARAAVDFGNRAASSDGPGLAPEHMARISRDTTPVAIEPPPHDDDILNFPRGADAGETLHGVFEYIDFTDPPNWPDRIAAPLQSLRTTRAASDDEQALRVRMVMRMMSDVLATPLPVGTAEPLYLAKIGMNQRLTEMEFHLRVHRLDAGALNTLLAAHGYPAPRLGFETLRGFLKGFIDMVVRHGDRYFIIDWKSNHLGMAPVDYGQASLAAAMAKHNYHLQSLLYCAALDAWLRHRLPNYDPQQHFGGSIYLFIRGVRPDWRDENGLPCGMVFDRPDATLLKAMSALLAGEPEPIR